MVHLKVYQEARKAIQEHKWLESEKAGRDLGVEAERAWTESNWLRFYRARFVQHLRGKTFFEEFGPECFALVPNRLSALSDLLDAILDRVQDGAENLDLICWARKQHLPREQVLEILAALDINSRRLPPPVRFEEAQ